MTVPILHRNPLHETSKRRNWQTLVDHGVPLWYVESRSYADFSAAAVSSAINGFFLPAGGIITACKIKHSEPFRGGGATSATMRVGNVSDADKYAGAYNVYQDNSPTTFGIYDRIGGESHSAEVAIKFTLAADVNLDQLTQGEVEIWTLFGIAD